MPQIIVMTGGRGDAEVAVMLRERINPADFDSEHFSAQLVERLGWAVSDAAELECDTPTTRTRLADAQVPAAEEPDYAGEPDVDETPEHDPIWAAHALNELVVS